MKLLVLGDVVGSAAITYLSERLWNIRRREGIDCVIANGENASEIHGLKARDAEAIFSAGVDVITLGNHAFRMKDLYTVLEDRSDIIRPANYPPQAPGAGYTVRDVCGYRLLCINVAGRAFMDPLASPFDTVDRILEREAGRYDFSLLDIHAEATSEKLALGYYFDGRIDLIFGTHTHVPTADERLLPKGSAYITDLGMCGPVGGILGTERQAVIDKMRFMLPQKFTVAPGPVKCQGITCTFDASLRAKEINRIEF